MSVVEYVRFQFEWSTNIKIIDIKNASVVIVVVAVAAGVDVVSESWKDIIITIYCYYKVP
jgi:hypothetical protein